MGAGIAEATVDALDKIPIVVREAQRDILSGTASVLRIFNNLNPNLQQYRHLSNFTVH
jgi:hypothetical protein